MLLHSLFNLLPVIAFLAIAYLFLAFRYVALAGRSREFYLFDGATGFILLVLIRFYMYKKRTPTIIKLTNY